MPLRIHLVQLLSPDRNSQRILCRLHSAPAKRQSVADGDDGFDLVGAVVDLQARALDILGATGRDSVERCDSRGESNPASVEDRLIGVEASMLELVGRSRVGDAPGMWV